MPVEIERFEATVTRSDAPERGSRPSPAIERAAPPSERREDVRPLVARVLEEELRALLSVTT